MKARRVLVAIEMTTDATIKELKAASGIIVCGGYIEREIHQIQVNVIKKEKEVKNDRV